MKRRVGTRWQLDEPDITIKGAWNYRYRAAATNGQPLAGLLTVRAGGDPAGRGGGPA